jgi:hypothetical protein
MVYTIDEITKDVRIAIDQNISSATLEEIHDVDTLALNEIIQSKILEGIKRVHSTAPFYLLDGGYNFGDAIEWEDKQSGWVLLPEDFMRFIMFQMDDWVRPVYNAISPDDAEYQKQQSQFKGIRGTAQRPVCAIVMRPEGRALEFYSCKSESAKVSKAMYLPYPTIDNENGVVICERCYNAVVYTIAALVATTFGDANKTNIFNELAKSALI